MIPDAECEAMRNITRTLEDIRDDLVRAKHRLTKFLLRHGHIFDEKNEHGQRIGNWTHAHWAWIRKITLKYEADEDTFAFYISQVRHLEAHKKQIEKYIRKYAKQERWCARVEALRALKGIGVMSAFAIVVEANVFSRFKSASAFSSWLGLVPSEHSNDERSSRGGVTKAGNTHIRKLMVEVSWHYINAHPTRKINIGDPLVSLAIQNHAAKGIKRLIQRRKEFHARRKKPVVANCATARELPCWVWAIGCMCEGSK